MSQVRATTKFNAYTFNALANYGGAVYAAMLAAAATFPTPPITLANFLIDLTNYGTLITLWGPVGCRGSHADYLNLVAGRALIEQDMRLLQNYVNQIANGDAPTVALSGFTGTNPHTVIGVLNAPQNFRQLVTRNTLPGQAILKWKKPTNIGFGKVPSYIVEVFTGGNWVQVAISTSTKATITSNVGGNPSTVRVTGINDAGNGASTAPITVNFM
jgi:hypothetical protein